MLRRLDVVPVSAGSNSLRWRFAAGILGAIGIHMFGAHQLSFHSAAVFGLGIVASEIAAIRIANHDVAQRAAVGLRPPRC